MNDFVSSSTDSDSEQAMNEALADVERTLEILDKILEKRLRSITRNMSKIGGTTISGPMRRRSSTASIIGNSISSVIGLITRSSAPSPTVFNPNAGSTNRFPASNGLQLSDLATLLQRISGRSL